MKTIRIFISNVQKEFVEERAALRDYLRGDPLFQRFFDVFLFEDVPAIDRRADEVYLHEVERCDIYVGLFGEEYGKEDEKGYSPTHRYIERMGTGTGDMIKRCRDFGLDEPEFALTDGFVVTIRRKPELAFESVGGISGEVTGEVTGEVAGEVAGEVTGEVTGEVHRLLKVLVGEMKRTDIQEALALRHEDYFREAYLIPALTAGIEMTIPGKPTSSKQKYRVTEKGQNFLTKQKKGNRD
jgi:hypothetical protein